MRFLVDANLPTALARWLVEQGHDASHVGDVLLQDATDTSIWDFALRSAATIVTKDADFAQRKILTPNGPAVVWLRLPNTRRRALLIWFETILPDVLSALARGDTLIEVVPR